ncbi:Saccharopine dehydrogenase-domain-containing protein [Kalaharituber pfeilii]|nr:Saccharopine dehydrogenase-domain-containing protein [Kalaharituber pfeilii]
MEPANGDIKPLDQRKYDIILIGATGVTGGLISKYLSANAPSIKWAIAGRSKGKLDNVVNSLGSNKPDVLVIDVLSVEEKELKSILEDTRLVIDVVGPYSYYGERVLKPCIQAGTAWIDLNGEVPWAKDMMDKYQSVAERTGAVIVPCCGYDCIPSDIGVFILSRFAGKPLGMVDAVVEQAVGSPSFGTLQSFLAPYYTYPSSSILPPKGYIRDPYFLYPHRDGSTGVLQTLPLQSAGTTVKRASSNLVDSSALKHSISETTKKSSSSGGYLITSSPMEAINRPVVMRTFGLRSSVDMNGARTHDSYGSSFNYREWVLLPPSLFMNLIKMPVAYFMGVLMPFLVSFSVVRGVLKLFFDKYFGPGYGPTPELQEKGGFRWKFIAEVLGHQPSNERAVVKVEGLKDPGYGWTSAILSETALYIVSRLRDNDGTVPSKAEGEYCGETAAEVKKLVDEGIAANDDIVFREGGSRNRKGGFWTTASLGMGLVQRLLTSGHLDVEAKWEIDSDLVVPTSKKTN